MNENKINSQNWQRGTKVYEKNGFDTNNTSLNYNDKRWNKPNYYNNENINKGTPNYTNIQFNNNPRPQYNKNYQNIYKPYDIINSMNDLNLNQPYPQNNNMWYSNNYNKNYQYPFYYNHNGAPSLPNNNLEKPLNDLEKNMLEYNKYVLNCYQKQNDTNDVTFNKTNLYPNVAYDNQQNNFNNTYSFNKPNYIKNQSINNNYTNFQNSVNKYNGNYKQAHNNSTNIGKGQNILGYLKESRELKSFSDWIDQYNTSIKDSNTENNSTISTNKGINFEKYNNIPIKTFGDNCPSPIENWESSNLNPVILENICSCSYEDLTPVQKYAISIILESRDLMACAQTGSGKTAAFLIPIINKIMEIPFYVANKARKSLSEPDPPFVTPHALILSPTRELALQIHSECLKLTLKTRIKCKVVYGGTKPWAQISNLRSGGGCHILVATPGRLRDILERRDTRDFTANYNNNNYGASGYGANGYNPAQNGQMGMNGNVATTGRRVLSLALCEFLVLDEADKMLDMGFEPQIRDVIENYDLPMIGARQTMLFSATFPKEIQAMAQDFLKDYLFLTVGKIGATTEDITQKLLWVEDNEKKRTLMNLLNMEDLETASILIFLERKKCVDSLENYLRAQGYQAMSIHGDHCQDKREQSLTAFKTGRIAILLATSVASRGLDIPNVKLVINYDMPNDIDEYIHRIGRTGRVGNTGNSTTFVNEKNRNVFKNLHKTLLQTHQDIPDFLETNIGQSNYAKK
ncbi:unnamed protein product [Gordionus sp. m RMFG-2023]|uniref:uncharacterized protein LOC135923597 isoform X2 n=1 Tax=Gordionus sp. m RMFG-2023 TaxID=3053472 RepID=UPI0030E50DF3